MVADASTASSLCCANAENYNPVWRDRQSGKTAGKTSMGSASEQLAARWLHLEVTNLSARFREPDRSGGPGLRGRKNADGKAPQSKRRWKELESRLS